MSARRLRAILVGLLVVATGLYVAFRLISQPKPMQIYGNLSPDDAAQIRATVLRDLGVRRAWLKPFPPQVRPWVPDLSHRIDIIWVRPDGKVQVFYRGSEVLFYRHGKEYRWGLASVGSFSKIDNCWTNSPKLSLP